MSTVHDAPQEGGAYEPALVEKKWQDAWTAAGLFTTPALAGKKKCYVLDMFPYPSGQGLHVGHPKGYIATDIYSRYQRSNGNDVLHPMGWDAFGLPAENYALANKVHPRVAVERNIARFKEQLTKLGLDYDWDRAINTTDPVYYRWTQWIFLQLFKAGLAYESSEPINWCPSCQTGLANEDVEDGHCERCGTPVEQRPMRQWMLKITAYADKLLSGLAALDWPESIKTSQRHWIGRQEGINITYQVKGSGDTITCFTTRPDTNFAATFLVIAPEHEFAQKVAQENKGVAAYLVKALHTTELERQAAGRHKSGAFTGYNAVNHLTGRELPIWVSDFVLGNFGSGAVVGVPGHDKRDFEFAQAMQLPVRRVVVAADGDVSPIKRLEQVQEAEGTMINSDFLDGLPIQEAIEKMTDYLEEKGWGTRVVSYRLKDWVFSRQRYWGEPIPIIHCEKCGAMPVPEEDLPVTLPDVERYEPTGTGESPLAKIDSWVNVACPTCAGPAKRETNTMPQWAGSSWYYLRYIDPKNTKRIVARSKEQAWMPVDLYVGGAEHATRHLIYARFWHRFLYDQGYVSTPEPFQRLKHVGLIAGVDGRKMSKRWGNVINPDDIVARYGADTLRVYEMFMGPFNAGATWSTESLMGAHRFLKRVWALVIIKRSGQNAKLSELGLALQQTVKRVTEGIEQFRFNTAIAALMELLNDLEAEGGASQKTLETYVQLLSPFAPHISEELWQRLGHQESILMAGWPPVDEKIMAAAPVTIPVQVNGRLRGTLIVEPGTPKVHVETAARELPHVSKYIAQNTLSKVIFVPDKLINFVVNKAGEEMLKQ